MSWLTRASSWGRSHQAYDSTPRRERIRAHRTPRRRLAPLALAGVLLCLLAGPSHAQWIQTSGPTGGFIRSFVAVPGQGGTTSLYSGQLHVWRTDDQGASWSHLKNGLTDPAAFALITVPNGSGGHDILTSTQAGVFRSSDGGASWQAIGNGIPNVSLYALGSGPNGSGGTNLYTGGFLSEAFRSTDNGASWTPMTSGLPVGQAHLYALTSTAAGTVLAGTGNGIYRSTDFGATWSRVSTHHGFAFAKHSSTLYAGTSNGVWRSTNDGATWTAINNGMVFTWTYAVAAIPNGSGVTLFAGAGKVMRSTDNGATWTIASTGLTSIGVYALATVPNPAGGTDLYAGTTEGIFRSTNHGDSWTNVSFIYSGPQGLEVTPSGAILAATENDVFRSTDGGATWTETNLNAPMLDFAVNPHGTSGVSLFAGGATIGVFKSTDDGMSWLDVSTNISDIEVNSVGTVPNGAGGTNVIAGVYSGIFVSTDDGGNWLNVEPNAMPLDFVVIPNGSGGHTVFGGGFGGVWRSDNGGLAWTMTGLPGVIPQGMATTGNGAHLFAGGYPFGVYRSSDQGATWEPVNNGLTDLNITSLVSPDGTNLFAGGAGGVFLSADQGNSWTAVGTGLTAGVASLVVSADGATLLAGTYSYGVWKRPIAEMLQTPVGVGPARPGAGLLAVRANPSAGPVEFLIPGSSPADMIDIFDVGGRRVDVLAIPAGAPSLSWHWAHAGCRPGVYLARLRSRGELVRFAVVR